MNASTEQRFRAARTEKRHVDDPVSDQQLHAEFLADTAVKSNFACPLGRGDPARQFARHPRLAFAQACRIE